MAIDASFAEQITSMVEVYEEALGALAMRSDIERKEQPGVVLKPRPPATWLKTSAFSNMTRGEG